MKKVVAYKTEGCKRKMDNIWVPRKTFGGKINKFGYWGYKEKIIVHVK